jgi:squalene-hopene/tetraprenyl-beta-curcumene cyclase
VPLWFGNQYEPALQNPVFGTARVVLAYAEMDHPCPEAERGLAYLVGTQNADGGWGGAPGLASTVEETALVLAALTAWPSFPHAADPITRGTAWLLARVEDGTWTATSPIGLYFSVLWYGEDLYPVTWTLDALGRVRVALVEPVSSSYQQDPPTTPSKA